jgi:hypothetical protein
MKCSIRVFLLAIAIMSIGIECSQATTLFSDTFSYPDGELTVYNGTGANVSNGAWKPHSGQGFPTSIDVVSGQAVLKSGNPASEDANRVAVRNGAVVSMSFGDIWYYAALITVNDERADINTPLNNDYFMHFKDAANGFRGRTFVDDPNAGVGMPGFTLGLATSSGVQNATCAIDLNFGQQYKIVVSYSLDTGLSELWVDPTNSSSPKISDLNPGAAFGVMNSLGIRQDFAGTGPSYEVLVDAVALGTDFDSVLLNVMNGSNIPEPGSIALAVFGIVGCLTARRIR